MTVNAVAIAKQLPELPDKLRYFHLYFHLFKRNGLRAAGSAGSA
ncbi:MAG TPA: hypothetical protein VNO50_04485 [Pyrinomonadaceae bacterium]|nr:hypothetical protein [Pyrinomonadaceae bacterium]